MSVLNPLQVVGTFGTFAVLVGGAPVAIVPVPVVIANNLRARSRVDEDCEVWNVRRKALGRKTVGEEIRQCRGAEKVGVEDWEWESLGGFVAQGQLQTLLH